MRSHVYRSAIAPVQGYVCLSCRHEIGRRLRPAQRRYQHNSTVPQDDSRTTSVGPTLTNLGGGLSEDGRKQAKEFPSTEASNGRESREVVRDSGSSDNSGGHEIQQKLTRNSNAKSKQRFQPSSSDPRSPKLEQVPDRTLSTNAESPQSQDVLGKLDKASNVTAEDFSNKSNVLRKTPSTSRVKEATLSPSDLSMDSIKTAISNWTKGSKDTNTTKSSARDDAHVKLVKKASANTEQVTKNDEDTVIESSHEKSKSSGVVRKSKNKEKAKPKKKHRAPSKAGRQSSKMVEGQDNTRVDTAQPTKTPKQQGQKVRNPRTVASNGPVITRYNSSVAIRKITSAKNGGDINDMPAGEHNPPMVAPRTTGIPKGSTSKIEMINASALNITPVEVERPQVPTLAYGLERVLFNQGVYQLQDPRSRVYNFDPYLQKIMPVAEFDFGALREYVTSSRDQSLQIIGKEQGKRYVGSTSSMSAVLAHFHFLLSQWRPINISMLSKGFPEGAYLSFTELQRVPQAIFLRKKDGCYAIDADKQFDSSNVLSMLGKSMEKLLTLETQDFEKYRRSNSDAVSEQERTSPESFHYSTLGDFLMRSQLDAHDPRLPGTGMFDLKTRAVISVRMDVENYEHGTGYEIKTPQGEFESYEREYYDMIRAAFLKYSMQVRMGRMDGIFVAFHNTERIFGFQYISLPEMDNTVHGQWDTSIGDQEFKLSLSLLNKILDKATKKYPDTSLRIHFETRDAATPFMYIFAEPVTEEQVADVQNTNLAKVQEFERKVLGRDSPQDQGPKWEDIHANVEKTMDEDESGLNEDEESPETRDEIDHRRVIGNADLSINTSGEEDGGMNGAAAADGEDSDNNLGEEEEEEEDEEEDDDDDEDEDENKEEDEEDEEEEEEEQEEADEENEDDQEVDENSQENDDGAESNEHKENMKAGNVEEFANRESAGDGEIESLSGPKPDSSEGNDMVDNVSGKGGETTEGHDHFSDSNTDLENDASRRESESFSAFSPTPEDPASSNPVRGDTKPDPDFVSKADQRFLDALSSPTQDSTSKSFSDDVLAMTLSLRNKVNDRHVLRPTNMTAEDKWEVEYLLEEVPDQARAKALYEACKLRRQKKLEADEVPEGEEELVSSYVRSLRDLSIKGRAWRKEMDQKDEETGKPISVVGEKPEDNR